MKKVLLIVFGIMSFAVADVHPGLKNAIDRGDVKTAEKLVKKVGVKDVYCPDNISFNDAIKIYGDVFTENPSKLWENCEQGFIKDAEKNICKSHVALCKYYLKDADLNLLKDEFEVILNSKIYKNRKKVQIQKEEYVKATKQECLDNLQKEKTEAMLQLGVLTGIFCSDDLMAVLCPKLYETVEDSVKKALAKLEKSCKTKPMKKIIKDVVVEQDVNPFLFEIEKWGIGLIQEMKNPFVYDKKSIELYKSLKKINNIDEDLKKQLIDNAEKMYLSENKRVDDDFLSAACLAYVGFDSLFNRNRSLVKSYGKNLSCSKVVESVIGNECYSLASNKKNLLIKQITKSYAETGYVPDSLRVFSCRAYPNIDKEISKIMDVSIFNCSSTSEFEKANRTCMESVSSYIWKSSSNQKYVCENNQWREAFPMEDEAGELCSEKNNETIVNGYVCEHSNWRKLSSIEIELGVLCKKNNDGHFVKKYVCDYPEWRLQTAEERKTKKLCNQNTQGVFLENYVCEDGSWRKASKEESIAKKTCTTHNIGEKKNGMLCKRTIGWVKTLTDDRDGRVYKTTKIGNQTWMAENLNYDYNFGSAESFCYENSSSNCSKYGRFYTWSAAMDSSGKFSTKGKGCGNGKMCFAKNPVRGVCPKGWHLPSIDEWEILLSEAGYDGKKLKSKNGWKNGNGRDEYSFSVLPVSGGNKCNLKDLDDVLKKYDKKSEEGRMFLEMKNKCKNGYYSFDIGDKADFWSTSETNGWPESARVVVVGEEISTENSTDKERFAPVRCVLDDY